MAAGEPLPEGYTGWIGDDRVRRILCAGAMLLHPDGSLAPVAPVARLVVEANCGPRRAARCGLCSVQHFRRSTRSLAPALVFSFETRETLARQFSMLAPRMPGIGFLRAPFTREEFEVELEKLEPLTPEQFQDLLRWHCGLQEEWQALAHNLGNALRDWPADRDLARQITTGWGASIREFAGDQLGALDVLEQVVQGDDPDAIRRASQSLERGLKVRPEAGSSGESLLKPGEALPEAPSDRAPHGCSAVLLADDKGDVGSVRAQLEAMGYTVEVACQPEEAHCLLEQWRPKVVLADLNFHTREKGQALMKAALALGAVVIGISKAEALPGDLPAGVIDCCGGLRFQDVDRIHRIIWQRAAERLEAAPPQKGPGECQS